MIARLGVLLGLNTAEFNQGLAQSGKKMEEFVGKAKGMATVAAGAFAAMTVKATMFADEVADIAAANDVAIDTVVKLQNSLERAGGEFNNAGKMFASFNNYVDKAAEGSFEAQRNFAKMGISLKDLESLTGEQLFLQTIQGIANIEDPLTRSAKAMEMLGKAAKGVDLATMAKEMQSMESVTDRQANAIKLLADFYGSLEKASRNLTLSFIDFLEPALRKINAALDKMSEHAKSGTLVQGFFSTLADDFKTARIQATLEEIERLNAKIADPNVGQFWKSGYRKELADAIKLLDELRGPQKQATQADVRRAEPVEPAMTADGKKGGKLRDVKEGVNPEEEKRKREEEAEIKRRGDMAAKAHRARMEEQKDIDDATVAYINYVQAIKEYDEAQSRALTTEERLTNLELQRSNMQEYNYQFLRSSISLTAELAEEHRKLSEASLAPKDREDAEKRLNELYQRRLQLLNMIREESEKANQDIGVFEGFKKAAGDFFKEFPKDMETGAMMFGSLMGNMSRALDDFVRTGKLNFKEFARSIILDMIAIQLKASAMKLLSSIFGFNLPARAMGGPVTGNSAYLVGERGPELFVPRMSGTIIPNHNLQSAGASTNITNYNIQAIDVKSFEQRLLGSSKAIWAANQYAQKGLAVTPGRM
jgi:lambda family phage tail tape measure protein